MACIASVTEAKKIRPTPRSSGSGTIFNSAEKIAASVPSLPAQNGKQVCRVFRRPRQRVARPAFQKSRRKTFGDLQRIERYQIFDQIALALQRVEAWADFDDFAVGEDDFAVR